LIILNRENRKSEKPESALMLWNRFFYRTLQGTNKKAMKKFLPCVLFACSCFFPAFSQPEGFVAAYDRIHATFSATYPFGQWKAVDWTRINDRIRAKIETAETANDTIAFYIAMREYAASVPDGHISMRNGMEDHEAIARYRQIGGSYGFALIKLDDNRYVTRLVDAGSPAAQAGIQFGAEILEINDDPLVQVLDSVPVIWGEVIPATLEALGLHQCRFIGRAPVGSIMKVKYLNRNAPEPAICTLTAVDDQYSTYDKTSLTPLEPGPIVSHKTIGNKGYGYIKLTTEGAENDSGVLQIYSDFRDAILALQDLEVPGLILDIRANTGGMDDLSAALAGFFYADTIFYEYQTYFNLNTGTIDIVTDRLRHINPATMSYYINTAYPPGALFIEPQGNLFSKPVVVMVGPRAISSGEGIPMALQKLPRCKVVSFYGTNGSFGMVGFELSVMEDLIMIYPYGQSLDRDLRIQLDSDSTLAGGVLPDIRVPLNDTVIDQLFIDSVDVELNYAMQQLDQLVASVEGTAAAKVVDMDPNYPNPFQGSTTFSYHLSSGGNVSLTITDLSGRIIRKLVDGPHQPGHYQVIWDAQEVGPGIYVYRLVSGGEIYSGKCMVIH